MGQWPRSTGPCLLVPRWLVLVSLVVARLPHRWSHNDCAVWDSTVHIEYKNYVKAVLIVGKALGAFWPGRGTGREPAGWVEELRCAAGSLRAQTVPTSFGNLL